MSKEVIMHKNRRLVVRPMQVRAIPQVQDLQRRCFGGLEPWDTDTFKMQLKRFGEGQIIVDFDNHIVATSSSLILLTASVDHAHSFNEVSDHGRIGTHNMQGDGV